MAKQSHDKALNLKSHYSYTAAKNSVLYLYLSYPSKSKDIRNLVKKKIRQELDVLFLPNSSFEGKFLGVKLPPKCVFYFFGLHYL